MRDQEIKFKWLEYEERDARPAPPIFDDCRRADILIASYERRLVSYVEPSLRLDAGAEWPKLRDQLMKKLARELRCEIFEPVVRRYDALNRLIAFLNYSCHPHYQKEMEEKVKPLKDLLEEVMR